MLAVGAKPAWFLGLLITSLASDFFDGYFARRFGTTSERGAHLDGWGDLTSWTAATIGVAVLWPELARREGGIFIAGACLFVVALIVSRCKFNRPPSYHTWSIKAANVVLSVGFFVLISTGDPWLFRAGCVLLVLSALEDIAITLVSSTYRHDVPTLWHARRLERDRDSGAALRHQG
jgi:phosphatidylserine synthase